MDADARQAQFTQPGAAAVIAGRSEEPAVAPEVVLVGLASFEPSSPDSSASSAAVPVVVGGVAVVVAAAGALGPAGATGAAGAGAGAAGVGAGLSRDAGRYLCNFAYWHMLRALPEAQVVFVHVPMPNSGKKGDRRPSMGQMERALRAMMRGGL